MKASRKRIGKGAVALLAMSIGTSALASSHREAPFITKNPKVDGTDFYMFRSYESGRNGFVTIIANYQPLQDAYGGPNYFTMDDRRGLRHPPGQQRRRHGGHDVPLPLRQRPGQ